MESPFPGMDPYLEAHWPDVHASLAVCSRDQLRKQMPAGLVVRLQEYMSASEIDEQANDSPKSRIIETEPATLRSVHVLDTKSGERIVTAIEFLSPANKIGRAGRQQYKRKRDVLFEASANLVEIDLSRQGGPILAIREDRIPSEHLSPYRICVLRKAKRDQAELYRAGFKDRLPRIRIPLRERDSDAILDVQDLIDRAYEEGQYGTTIDYRANPRPPLLGDDAAWAEQLLHAKGLR